MQAIPNPIIAKFTAAQLNTFLEVLGAATGIIGAVANATVDDLRPLAFTLWIVSSIALSLYGYRTRAPGIVVMSLTYTAINIAGLYRLSF